MASVKIYYNVQSCPKCGKKLLKVQSGTVKIGSPFLDCKKCGVTYITPLRVEWYKYPSKWVIFAMPFIITAALFVAGTIMEDPVIGIVSGMFGLVFGICFVLPDVFRIFRSIRRMRDPAYLKRLLQAQLISYDEYNALSTKK